MVSFLTIILQPISGFQLTKDSLNIEEDICWIQKLSNLRNLIKYIEKFFEDKHEKGIKTNDIDLIEIARQSSLCEITKLFEVVVATMMQSPNKQTYIECIMCLDQRSQSAFVKIVNNGIQKRSATLQQIRATKINYALTQCQMENAYLKDDILELYQTAIKLEKENQDLINQVNNHQEQFEKLKCKNAVEKIETDELPVQNQQLKNLVANLKDKLMVSVIEHQTEVSKLKEQLQHYQSKILQINQLEETISIYKEKYEQVSLQLSRFSAWEKQRNKFMKIIDEKDNANKKLHEKIEQLIQKNYQMQQNEVYLKMELQKKQVRFRQLQRQVKNRLKVNDLNIVLPAKENLSILDQNRQDFEELRNQNQKLRHRTRQVEKQNRNLSKKVDKCSFLENEKGRLQKMIIELSKMRTEQMQTLMVAFYELRQQNIKMHQIIQIGSLLNDQKNSCVAL